MKIVYLDSVHKIGGRPKRLYSGDGCTCRKHHSGQTIFRMLRNFDDDKMYKVLQRALFQEHTQPASVYTLYSGGDLSSDCGDDKWCRENYEPIHSTSYGQSLFSSCEMDIGGAGSIPLEYIRLLLSGRKGYGVVIDKDDFYRGKAGHFFVIPPAQRTARFRLKGEFTHARGRVYPYPNTNCVHGMQQNVPLKKVPFIVTEGKFQSIVDFERAWNRYLIEHGSELSSNETTAV